MAIELSSTTKALKNKTNIRQQIVVTIDGFSDLFGAVAVEEIVKYGSGHTFGEAGLVYGGLVESNNSLDYISLEGTTTRINSQVNIEDGLPNSISRFRVNMIDKDDSLSAKFQPGNIVADMLGREANVYTMLQGGSYPEDATRIFLGIIDDISYPPGEVRLSISSPEKFRQSKIFLKYNDKLNGSITDSDTTIVVDSTVGLIDPTDILQTYIRIGDELLEVTSIDSATNLTCTRGQLGTTAAAHDDNTEIESFYRLTGNPIEMALKLMISSSSDYYIENLSVSAFNQVSPTLNVTNAIYFPDVPDIEDAYGVTEGDLITIESADNASNDVVDAVISGFGKSAPGSYVVVTSTLVTDTGNSATAKIKSQYNTLPVSGKEVAGFGIKPKFIDVLQFQSILDTNSSFFEDYDLYVKDEVDGEEFIATKILFPAGVLSTVRKARTSGVFLSPPVVTNLAPVLSQENIEKPEQIVVKRSINTNFYNSIVFKFGEDPIEDKFRAGEIVLSTESTNRIDVPTKELTIEAPGYRDTVAVRTLLSNLAERFLQRYRYGAESIDVYVSFRDSFNIDLRDAVVFDGSGLNMANTLAGNRIFTPRVMQIFSRDLDLKTGFHKLTLVDSIYDTGARYISVAPSSYVNSGATTTVIPLKKSFGTGDTDEENEKWERLVGEKIKIRSADFTYEEETTFNGFVSGQPNSMSVDALSMAPSEDYIVEPADYDESDATVNALTKSIHGSLNAQITVLAGNSSTEFTVTSAAQLQQGMEIRVHNEDYSNDSGVVEITDITGTTITVEDMGFTPASGDLIDRIGYTDGGDPYVYL